MIYTLQKPAKMGIYYNKNKKSISAIKQELGATFICNLNLFNNNWTGCCFTKANGEVVGDEGYVYDVLTWNTTDGKMIKTKSNQTAKYSHAFGCLELVKDGKYCVVNVPAWASGNRPRTAIGIKANGEVVVCCNQLNVSIKTVAEDLIAKGVVYAINVDGGGSTQWITPTSSFLSGRVVHTLFYAVETNDIKTICPYKEPTANIRLLSVGEGAKWTQWQLINHGYLDNTKKADGSYREVDGIFGAKSVAALKKFQKNNGLTDDGISGAMTRAAFNRSVTVSAQTSQTTTPTTQKPVESEKTPSNTTTTTYTIRSGDTWWDIAQKFLGDGARYKELISYNGKTSEFLKVGETIKIPVNSTTSNTVAKTDNVDVKILKEKREKMLDIIESMVGGLYIYGSQGQEVTDALIDWSAKCYPAYTTSARAARMKKYIKDHKGLRAADCSGLFWYAENCVELPLAANDVDDSTAAGLYQTYCKPISKSELQPLDLVFNSDLTHVAVVGRNGKIYEAQGSDIGIVVNPNVDSRYNKSIYGSAYGCNDYYYGSPWTKFGRLKIYENIPY